MRPIRDIAAIRPGSVLHHSAFGFARVSAVDLDEQRVELTWQTPGENLPDHVSMGNLRRVYTLCPPHGFFERAVLRPEELKEMLGVNPLEALELLIEDVGAPQDRQDVHDWVVGCRLMSERAYARWWENLGPLLEADSRFHVERQTVYLDKGVDMVGPVALLKSSNLPPGRRLDLALTNRKELDAALFLQQVLLAIRTGGTQVKELGLAALRGQSPAAIINGLLTPGPDNIDALIFVIRRGGWDPESVGDGVPERLVARVLQALHHGGPADREGRLAATLARWGCPGALDAFARLAINADGRRLLRAALTALPARRAGELAIDLLQIALGAGEADAAEWLGTEALAAELIDERQMVAKLEADGKPHLAGFFREDYQGIDQIGFADYDDRTEETSISTAEVEFTAFDDGPVTLAQIPPRGGQALLGLGLGMARALIPFHKHNLVAVPTADTVQVRADDTMEILSGGDPAVSFRYPGEEPSLAADIYAAAQLLVQAMVGRPWPSYLLPSRALAYLNGVISMLPPSALAPLTSALHPDPECRPANALEWLSQWQAAAVAEENRAHTRHDTRQRLAIGFDTHVGRMKVLHTQVNQDAIFAATKDRQSLLVVCDGISTSNVGSGDMASGIASQIIANLWEAALPRLDKASPSETRDFLDRALRVANQAVCEAALRLAGGDLDGRVPMGTTCTIAMVNGNRVNIAWLGDSRAYLVGPYGASLLTADENQACERLRGWHLGLLEVWDPVGFALTGYLGHFDETFRPEALSPHHTSFTLLPGERLMISSDGVTDYIGETFPEVGEVLVTVLQDCDDMDQACRSLVNFANRAGGGDNASILVASLTD